jgi:hypothetical protein
MLQIIYASAASKQLTTSELVEIIDNGLSKNEKLGITGIVMYDAGSFLQVLEGPDDAVERLYTTIARDPRHTNVRLLSQKYITEREFGDWSMTFAVPDGTAIAHDGFLDYASTGEEFSLEGSEVSQILSMFRDGLLRQADLSDDANCQFTVTVGSRAATVKGRQARFLMDFGRALALTVPDVQIGVRAGEGDPIHFNLRREMEKGEIEMF